MNREEKIRKSEDRRPKTEDRSRKSEVGTLIAIGREKGTAVRNFSVLSFAVEFIQREKEHKKRKGNVEYRISNNKSGSGANNIVSYFLFLISYFLFLPLWLKPMIGCISSFRQLKLTAKDRAVRNLSALSFAVEFIQREKEHKKRKGNVEYRISNVESGSGANNIVSYFLFLISYSDLNMWLKPVLCCNNAIRQLKQTAIIVANSYNLTLCQFDNLKNEIQQLIIINQISFNPLRQLADADLGAPCRQFGFAGDFLSIKFLTMRELKQVLTKKVLAFLLPIYREVGGGSYCL